MITATGYSKDPTIIPEGIVITFGKDMMSEQGGVKNFLRNFHEQMESEHSYWMHKCSNLPTTEVDLIYISVLNRLYGRVYNGGYRANKEGLAIGVTADDRTIRVTWPYITLAGPFEKCPHRRELKGFQGFRYCTKLF